MSDKTLPDFPVMVIHLEDPPGSGLAACCGQPIGNQDKYREVPRWGCTGCLRPRVSKDAARRLDEAIG